MELHDKEKQRFEAIKVFYLDKLVDLSEGNLCRLPVLYFANKSVKKVGKNLILDSFDAIFDYEKINTLDTTFEEGSIDKKYLYKIVGITHSKDSKNYRLFSRNGYVFQLEKTDIEVQHSYVLDFVNKECTAAYCTQIYDNRAVNTKDYSVLSEYKNDYLKDKAGILDNLCMPKRKSYIPAANYFPKEVIDAFIEKWKKDKNIQPKHQKETTITDSIRFFAQNL
jgi:hypothetical protein